MNETKHTHGLWRVSDAHGLCVVARQPEEDHVVADLENVGVDPAESRANAQLIAASPELLAALQELEYRTTCAMGCNPESALPDTYIGRAVKQARAAIAKAEGGNQ